MRALTAMLNHRGGRVLFGVEADGREVLAVSVPQGQSRPYIYDDRLEITSSGSLHFGLTPDALMAPHESLPWNPLIARAMYRRGLIEQWGRGTLKIAELMQQAGLPRPEIEDAGGCVTVRLAPARYIPPQRVARDLTDRQRAVLARLEASCGGLALRDVRQQMEGQATEWEVRGDLQLLRQLGLVESLRRGRDALWRLVWK